MRSGRLAVLAAAGALVLPGCTSFADPGTAGGTTAARTTTPPPAPEATGSDPCPDQRAAPDPDRPDVALHFRLADDGGTVTGTETVNFTPDLDVRELVFRLVPNGPDSAPAGNRLVVDHVHGDDVAGGSYEEAAASDPGGLYVVALEDELAAGESTEVELDFTLSLGSGTFDRFGHDDGLSWWASGAPLLAWEPGVGWARDPFVALSGETATSPAADTRVSVSAPADRTVLMTGVRAEPSDPRNGRRTWTSAEPVARDVGVAAGPFTTAEGTTPDGAAVTVGTLPGSEETAPQLLGETLAEIGSLEGLLGPFPYGHQTVALLPDYGGGIEYPGMIFEASPSRGVLVHELAHMWFYGMVGNSQFRDPWLDEALASWAEAVVDGDHDLVDEDAIDEPGPVGGSMSDYTDPGAYFSLVYDKGGAALLAARDAAGPAAFDAAIGCYVRANAWSIATPADLGAALAGLPAAVDVLVRAEALDPADVPG
jgi:hypothetical protein